MDKTFASASRDPIGMRKVLWVTALSIIFIAQRRNMELRDGERNCRNREEIWSGGTERETGLVNSSTQLPILRLSNGIGDLLETV